MLTLNERGISEKMIVCGDFYMPSENIYGIDDRSSALLDVHSYQQHVYKPTGTNLLNLVICVLRYHRNHSSYGCEFAQPVWSQPRSWWSVDAEIQTSHHVYRNLKNMDIVDFKLRLDSYRLFINPADTPDEYLSQLESAGWLVIFCRVSLIIGLQYSTAVIFCSLVHPSQI